jgi:hypothetical protein
MNRLFFQRALALVPGLAHPVPSVRSAPSTPSTPSTLSALSARLARWALLLAPLATLLTSPAGATDVGVSVRISQPGVYGRVDIGRFPQPQVWVPQPVWVVQPVQVVQAPPPVYLWVPPGHRKHWRKHCARYGACAHPVYFVRDDWYGQHVHPHPPRRVWHGDGHGLRPHGTAYVRDMRHARDVHEMQDAWHANNSFRHQAMHEKPRHDKHRHGKHDHKDRDKQH